MNKMMKTVLVGAAAAATLGGATLGAGQAEARGWGPGAAIGAGILGVAVGASLAQPHYAPEPVYYGPPPAYYAGPGPGYYDACRAHWRWDPYWGRYVRVERCY